MAGVGSKECLAEDAENSVNTESAGFQKNLFDLFEKNGILNDLRAYLRCQIVDVLKSAQTGGLPACQRHFTQRLELTSQALNILLAEYLLKHEFSYTLSVFISEIPLANMVFGFAKTLLKCDKELTELSFEDGDVWTILNYLGIQCDSEHAASVLEMYKSDKHVPLLLCILKAMPMYNPLRKQPANSSDETLLTPRDSAATLQDNISPIRDCKHFVVCKPCQNRIIQVKEKYKVKKRTLAKHTKDCEVKTQVVENVMKDITFVERNIMDEMFEHLKSVYESEMEMVKVEQASKVKRSVASCQMYLQKKCDDLEQSYKAREAELESNIQQKKKFLWGLARALREQHNSLNNAMQHVQIETGRLSAKEDSLKSQLAEAETVLKQKRDAMRSQIAQELAILSTQLETMKYERDTLSRERSELENLKQTENTKDPVQSHYDLVHNELVLLRNYVESTQIKNVVDKATNTVTVLNNTQERMSKLDDFENRLKANQLVNDFRKKNVNFNQDNIDIDSIYPEQRERSRSSGSSEGGDTLQIHFDRERTLHLVRTLRDENQRLKRQQNDYAERLENQSPPVASPVLTHPVSTAASTGAISSGWCKGAGEELGLLRDTPRILRPGDNLPFIGVLGDRHPARRQLLTQWRGSRTRCPVVGISKRTISPLRDRIVSTSLSGHSSSKLQGREMTSFAEEQPNISSSCRDKQSLRAKMLHINKNREKSPKSVLREAKEKLRNNTSSKDAPPREKSPTTVLRDAKLRLRKLEIEAEAAENSYRNFKQRQSELKFEGTGVDKNTVSFDSFNRALQLNRNTPQSKSRSLSITAPIEIPTTLTQEYDKFISNYKNLNTNHQTRNTNQSYHQENFLEKPLIEFRKFYRQQKHDESIPSIAECDSQNSGEELSPPLSPPHSSRKEALKKVKNDKQAEFEILKQNIDKMYNGTNSPDFKEKPIEDTENDNLTHLEVADSNLLHIEIESASEIHDIVPSNELLLVVSSVENPQVIIAGSSGSSHTPRQDIYGPKCIEETDTKSPDRLRRSESPEKAANLTKNDVLDAIFHAEPGNNASSVRMTPSKDSKASSISEYDKDYPDDFSADVDNYGRSDYGSISPISQAKNYEDDNFWESSI